MQQINSRPRSQMKKTEGEESKGNKDKGLYLTQDNRQELQVSNASQTLQAQEKNHTFHDTVFEKNN